MDNATLNLKIAYNKKSDIVNTGDKNSRSGSFSDYRELEDNSANSHSILQQKALCDSLRDIAVHKTLPAGALYLKKGCSCRYCDAMRELIALVGVKKHSESDIHAKNDTKSELREFYSDMRRRKTYAGFGDEALMCGSRGQLCECEQGHLTLKRVYDAREWCPRCGKDGSDAHKRRTMRMVDRVYSLDTVGYMVLEVNKTLRSYFEDAYMLRKLRSYARELLKRELKGFTGVSRWHYYGDKRVEVDDAGKVVKIVEGDTSCTDYKPHLNILHNYGFVRKKTLKRIRLLWSKRQFELCDKRYYKVSTVYNKYSRSEGKLWHWLRYINRATFTTLNDGNKHIARGLFKFNNCSWLGKFSTEAKERGRARFEAWRATLPDKEPVYGFDIEAHERFDNGFCAVCGALTHGEGIVKVDDYEILVDYGGGLYLVVDIWEQARIEAHLRLEKRIIAECDN